MYLVKFDHTADVWRCVFMEMKQIELELAYVGYVKITDGAHVIKLCKETCLQRFEWDGGLLSQQRASK